MCNVTPERVYVQINQLHQTIASGASPISGANHTVTTPSYILVSVKRELDLVERTLCTKYRWNGRNWVFSS
jgi:hypothetical protein